MVPPALTVLRALARVAKGCAAVPGLLSEPLVARYRAPPGAAYEADKTSLMVVGSLRETGNVSADAAVWVSATERPATARAIAQLSATKREREFGSTATPKDRGIHRFGGEPAEA